MKNQFFFIFINIHAYTRSRARYIYEKHKLYFVFIKFHAFTRSRTRYMHEKSIFSIFSYIFMHLPALERSTCMKSKTLFHFHKISCIYPLSNEVYAWKINLSIFSSIFRCICQLSSEVHAWKAILYFIFIKFHEFTRSWTRLMHEKSIFLYFHKYSCIYPLSSKVYLWKA